MSAQVITLKHGQLKRLTRSWRDPDSGDFPVQIEAPPETDDIWANYARAALFPRPEVPGRSGKAANTSRCSTQNDHQREWRYIQ